MDKPFACADAPAVVRSIEKLVNEEGVALPIAFQASFKAFCGSLDGANLPSNFFPPVQPEAQIWRDQVVDELVRGVPAPTATAPSPSAPSVAAATPGVKFTFANGEQVLAEASSAEKRFREARNDLAFYVR